MEYILVKRNVFILLCLVFSYVFGDGLQERSASVAFLGLCGLIIFAVALIGDCTD